MTDTNGKYRRKDGLEPLPRQCQLCEHGVPKLSRGAGLPTRAFPLRPTKALRPQASVDLAERSPESQKVAPVVVLGISVTQTDAGQGKERAQSGGRWTPAGDTPAKKGQFPEFPIGPIPPTPQDMGLRAAHTPSLGAREVSPEAHPEEREFAMSIAWTESLADAKSQAGDKVVLSYLWAPG